MEEDKNPLVCVIEGIEIRKVNKVTVTLNSFEYTRLVHAHINTDKKISLNMILAMQGQPCQKCGNDAINVVIPRAILSVNKGSNGGNISTKHNHGK